MKKSLLSIVLCIIVCGTSFSQTETDKQSAFQLSFVPPLSTNGKEAPQYTNAVSFNLLVGVSQNETVLTFGGLANIIKNNSKGVQFAGLVNYIGNGGNGLLFSGLANITRNNYSGLHFAGLINTVKNMNGLQFAGLVNNVYNMSGSQFAGLVNNAKNIKGSQLAGLVNTVTNIKGLQLAGLANKADNVSGSQFAGIINIADNVSGVQLAGLVNIAENSNYPIGIINLIKKGEKSISVAYYETGSTVATFRSGGKYTYGIIGLGHNHKTEGGSFVTVGGLGAHINCTSWLRINNEITSENISNFSKETTFKSSYALLPAFRIGKHVELFGGPSINYMQSNNLSNIGMFPKNSLWKDYGDSKLQQIYIGYQFGVQYVF